MNEFLIKLISNGGVGSGNFNPGQGRGVGKPGAGSKGSSSAKSKGEKALKEARKEEYMGFEPSERVKEKARKAIIEVDPNYDLEDYDELVDHAYDLVDRANTIKELKEILEREYGGFFTSSDIDEILEIDRI